MFNAKAIRKAAKRDKDGFYFQGAKIPMPEKLKGAEKVPQTPIERAQKVPESPVPTTKKVMPEDQMSMDMMLRSARKPIGANAASAEGEEFEVEKDEKGMWKESGAAKERYLKAIGKLKKKK